MTISHPAREMKSCEAFVFANLGGFTCSICAPNAMTKDDVESFAEAKFPAATPAPIGGWEAVDKSKAGLGGATPNPCNIDPENRTHWFLLDGLRAAAMGFETKK